MNELTKALRFADTAIKTVRVIDVIKKAVIFFAAIMCGVFVFRFFRK